MHGLAVSGGVGVDDDASGPDMLDSQAEFDDDAPPSCMTGATMWLRNCWYVIAWDHEIPAADCPAIFHRTVLGEPIVASNTVMRKPKTLTVTYCC
jgi:hypothetical protein